MARARTVLEWSDEIVWVEQGQRNLGPLARGSARAGLQNGAEGGTSTNFLSGQGISVLTVSTVESLVCVDCQKTLKIKSVNAKSHR